MSNPTTHDVAIDRLDVDETLQARARLDEDTVARYEATLRQALEDGTGWPFPPLVCVYDLVVDGFHRLGAAKRAGLTTVPVVSHSGEREDAIRLAVSANANHGLPRSRDDIHRAIIMAAEAWPDLSARAIGRLVGCSHPTVTSALAKHRQEESPEADSFEQVVNLSTTRPDSMVSVPEGTEHRPPKPDAPSKSRSLTEASRAVSDAKKTMAFLEAAMRSAGDHRAKYEPANYQRFNDGIDELWEIARAWSKSA